jgi:hypothetical protein
MLALAVLLGVLGCLLLLPNVLNGRFPSPSSMGYTLAFLAFLIVGLLIASHRPENPIGWMLCIIGLTSVWEFFAQEYAFYALLTRPGALPGGVWMAWTQVWTASFVWALMFLALLLFPTGRLPSPRWRPVAWVIVGGIFVLSVLTAFEPGLLPDLPVPNPTGMEQASSILTLIRGILILVILSGILAVAASVTVRFRRARGEERQQLKWLAYSAGFLIGTIVLGALNTEVLHNRVIEFAAVLNIIAVAAVPTAIGVAILRYRLYDIDLIINRTLVYGALTAMLALVYVGGVVGLQAILRAMTGQESTLAVVASTLTIAALFSPLRRRVQGFVDRRFYRSKYDARTTLEAFSATLRDETDLKALNDELVGVARSTLQPEHVSLWLRPDTASKGKPSE